MDDEFKYFTNRLGFYNLSIFQISTHIEEFSKYRLNTIDELTKDFNFPIVGKKLIYRNVLTSKYEVASSEMINRDNLVSTTTEIINHYSNYCVSQSFETFVRFLKRVTIRYLIQNSSELAKTLNIDTSDYDNCKSSIDTYCKKDNKYNKQLFKILYLINPEIAFYESNNFLDFNFKEWNVVLTEVRHAITHSDSRLIMDKTSNWTDFQLRLLTEIFQKEKQDSFILIKTNDDYDYIIKIIAQHGQLIYDKLKNKNVC